MEIFVHDTDWNEQFLTPSEFALEHDKKDGETFELVRVSVAAKTTYRMIDGNAVPESLAFVQTLTPNKV